MKRTVVMLLTFSILLGLTACGGASPAQTEAPETVPASQAPAEATTLPATEPTLSAEELLYQSLSDRMKQAVDASLLTLSQLEDPQRIVTVGEASEMLQKAYIHRTGAESKTLQEFMTNPDYSGETATLIWIAGVPGIADMELSHGEHYENYGQWRTYLNTKTQGMADLWWSFSHRLNMKEAVPGYAPDRAAFRYDENGDTYSAEYGVYWNGLFQELPWPDSPLYAYEAEDPTPVDYGRQVYDSTNGRKYYTLTEDMDWLRGLTVEEVAECALVYFNFPNPMAYPDFVAPEDVGSFDPQIITADLLEKETDLPTPSCENLPAQWHGTVMDDMTVFEQNLHTDDRIYEYEIQQIKAAGFNFIGLNLDFSWLQDNVLMDEQKDAYVDFVKEEDVGKLSLERLKQLDQVVALCMKYDIHLNLRVTDAGDRNNANRDNGNYSISSRDNASKLAARWQAIARRYAQIPNEYLSFTLFTSISNQDATAAILLPSAESIRQVSPDRCIIADIYGWKMTFEDAKAFAEAGVALSSRIVNPEKIYNHMGWPDKYYSYDGVRSNLNTKGRTVIETFDWPYQGQMDAAALLAMDQPNVSVEAVMEVAREYGVGFMLSDFGVTLNPYQTGGDDFTYPRFRYGDEAYFAMIRDITSTLEARGYGWCFAHWYGPYGVAFCIPAIQTSTYAQVEDYPYYIDQGMMTLFQEINAVR